MMRPKALLILMLVILSSFSVLLAGCGDDATPTEDAVEILPSKDELPKDPFGGAPLKIFAIRVYRFAFEPNILEADQGDHVRITITSTDVGHGFALPDFGINKKIPPQESVTIDFIADKSGEFEFFSSVYSGSGYENMKGKLIVKENPAYVGTDSGVVVTDISGQP